MSAALPALKGIDQYFIANHLEFKKIFDSFEPQNDPMPGDWDTNLNTFQKLIVIKSLRPDKITLAVANFVI
jgi:dynein heavy chain